MITQETAQFVTANDASGAVSSAVVAASTTVSMIDVTKGFGTVTAVKDVSMTIEAGEFVSLLGPSGSGKTTVLMMLAGFETPTSGEIRFGGSNVTDVPSYSRNIGMVFQSYALFPNMTVFQNIAYPLKIRKIQQSVVAERVRRALDLIRLPASQYANRFPHQLSGGQRQRVALARALVYEPGVLLMDEPMGALDKNLREELKLELLALQKRLRLTVLYVTHDQGEAMMLSDRIAVMRDGRIEQIASPRELYQRPKTEFVARFLGEANLLPMKVEPGGKGSLGHGIQCKISERLACDGREWMFMLRPEEIDLVEPERAMVTGRVRNTVFLGSTIRTDIDTALGVITAIVKTTKSLDLRQGDNVGLQFATDDPIIVPASS